MNNDTPVRRSLSEGGSTINDQQSKIFTEYLQVKGFAKSTREKILRTAQHFIQWCESENIPLLETSYNDITAYVSHCKAQGNKPRTVQIVLVNLKHYYAFLIEQQLVAENPCTNVQIHGVTRKHLYETFTGEELDALYKAYANKTTTGSGVGGHITHKPVLSLSKQRNKVILGLMIWQGLRVEEIARLRVSDVLPREGKIKIEAARRTQGRELSLEAHQVYELMDYLNETRKMILALTGKQTQNLFTSIGTSENVGNMMHKLVKELQKINPRIRDFKQIRASVIVNWLKQHNIRKVQQMAGHRYVSSTEAYQANNMDELKEDVNRYHPNI